MGNNRSRIAESSRFGLTLLPASSQRVNCDGSVDGSLKDTEGGSPAVLFGSFSSQGGIIVQEGEGGKDMSQASADELQQNSTRGDRGEDGFTIDAASKPASPHARRESKSSSSVSCGPPPGPKGSNVVGVASAAAMAMSSVALRMARPPSGSGPGLLSVLSVAGAPSSSSSLSCALRRELADLRRPRGLGPGWAERPPQVLRRRRQSRESPLESASLVVSMWVEKGVVPAGRIIASVRCSCLRGAARGIVKYQIARHSWLAKKRMPRARTRISLRPVSSVFLLIERGREGLAVGVWVFGSTGSPMSLVRCPRKSRGCTNGRG
ncbi:hypothetical protein N8I77_008347 [Diaporthe amygdali]|uniref:Uncharacterized protein n=1 Tax=Phomopsis amygdali TaxID=1214568 RepID=A0AAD9W2Z4_PHOAM|nr:hypothetical protein N8I77_008347 [Diaporthe amygdali]